MDSANIAFPTSDKIPAEKHNLNLGGIGEILSISGHLLPQLKVLCLGLALGSAFDSPDSLQWLSF